MSNRSRFIQVLVIVMLVIGIVSVNAYAKTSIPTDSTPIISNLPALIKPSGPILDVEVITKIRAIVNGLTASVIVRYVGNEDDYIYLNYFETIFIEGSPSKYSPGEVIYHEDLNKTLYGSHIWRIPIARIQGQYIVSRGMDWFSERHVNIKYNTPLFEIFSTEQGTVNYTIDNVTKSLTIMSPTPGVPTGSERTVRFVISYTTANGEEKFITKDKIWIKRDSLPLTNTPIPKDYGVLLNIGLNDLDIRNWVEIYKPDKISFSYSGYDFSCSPGYNNSLAYPTIYDIILSSSKSKAAFGISIIDSNMSIIDKWAYDVNRTPIILSTCEGYRCGISCTIPDGKFIVNWDGNRSYTCDISESVIEEVCGW